MSLFKYRRANIALFGTTKIQNYFHVSKCAYVYFHIKEVFFPGKIGRNLDWRMLPKFFYSLYFITSITL